MYGCTSLETLILPPNIKKIGCSFLEGCTHIKELNLSHLTKLTHIDYKFFKNCINLETFILPSNVEYIGRSFLEGCTHIKELNLLHLIKLNYDNLFENNLLVFIQVNKSMKWKLQHKSLNCLVSNKFNSFNIQSLYHFTTHVILNVNLNIHLGIL